jgi:hypothetical protein
MDDEALELLMRRNTPVVPAYYFELASVERGRDIGMSQAVIDGHQETLEGGGGECSSYSEGWRTVGHGRRLWLRLESAWRLCTGVSAFC